MGKETFEATLRGDPAPTSPIPAGDPLAVTMVGEGSPGGELELSIPARIGRYVVLRRLGVGAMGMVLVAFDPELDRRVAVKLIHPRAAAREDARARMLREAKGLARVSHPNVIQVYDAGTVDGRVFIAMELVDGKTLTRWQRAEGRTQDQIISVYLDAGRGLAAAHDADLVHRDFKPDNVLVDRAGRARVLDFGLVRAIGTIVEAEEGGEPSIELALGGGFDIDHIEVPLARAREVSGASRSELDSKLTMGGALMGTPAYMSPEQWRGQHTDARSDQFSFCVALWEALCDERPFQGRTTAALVYAVCNGDLTPPAAGIRLSSRVRAALERGLSAEPGDRFADMRSLLSELGRDDWARRSLPLAMAAILGFGVLAWGRFSGPSPSADAEQGPRCELAGASIEDVWGADVRAEVGGRFALVAEQGHESATVIRTQLERGLDDYAQRWREAALDNCEATHVDHRQSAELQDLRGRCLSAKRTELAAFVEVLARADADVVDEALAALEGLPSLRACGADEVLASGPGLPDDEDLATRVIAARADLAGARASLDLGRFSEAQTRIETLVLEVESIDYAPLRAELDVDRGRLFVRLDEHAEAEVALRRGFLASTVQRDDALALTAAVWLAELESNRGRPEFAELWADQAEALLARAPSSYPGLAADLADNLSWNAYLRGDYALAHDEAARGLARLDQAELAAPMRRVALHLDVGVAAYARGDLSLAEQSFERSLSLATGTVGRGNAKTSGPLNNLAFTFRAEGDLSRARGLLSEALRSREREFGDHHASVGLAASNLADLDIEMGEGASALVLARRAFDILRTRRGPDALGTLLAQHRLGLAHGLTGDFEAGLEVLGRAAELALAEPNPDLRLGAEIEAHQAVLYAAAGDPRASKAALARALDSEAASWGDLIYVGHYAVALGQPDLAMTCFESAELLAGVLDSGEDSDDAGARRRLAVGRLWHAQLYVERDPSAARALLAEVSVEDLDGAPHWIAELARARAQLGVQKNSPSAPNEVQVEPSGHSGSSGSMGSQP